MTTIAIIGAGKGLGAAVARRFGKEGFAVGLISRHQGRLDALAAELEQDGVQAKGFIADVRDPASIAAALEQVDRDARPDRGAAVQPAAAEGLHASGAGDDAGRPQGPDRVLDLRPRRRGAPGRPGHAVPARGVEPEHPLRQRRLRREARPQRHRHLGRLRRPGGVRRAAARGARRGGHLRRPADHRRPHRRGRRGEGPRRCSRTGSSRCTPSATRSATRSSAD